MRRLVPQALLGVVALVALLGGGVARANQPDRSPSPSAGPTQLAVSVPIGWKTYTFGHAAISVPADWVVRHETDCPDGHAPGTLLLGIPRVLQSCPEIPASVNEVAMSSLVHGSGENLGAPERMNGVLVYPITGSLTWDVPSLGIVIVAAGSDAQRILHTLRRA
jgi:hypothetical protein